MSASSLLLASTSVMAASGAMAWAHWTSREISTAQPTWLGSFSSNGVSPSGATMVNLGSGRPKVWSNRARSSRMVGLWKASTMAMVRPRPVMPAL